MEQVKIFTQGASDEFTELEEKANKWLSEHPDITITAREMGVASGTNLLGNGFVNCTIVIFYLE
jgi:hypothetical protein